MAHLLDILDRLDCVVFAVQFLSFFRSLAQLLAADAPRLSRSRRVAEAGADELKLRTALRRTAARPALAAATDSILEN